MKALPEVFKYNKSWAEGIKRVNPNFFVKLSHQQKPKYLWIGCSDSRVPANQLMGLAPGEIFVHRNIANCFNHTDMNALSVLQYAVDYLEVQHIIVCGHYLCGGVKAALGSKQYGLIDNWLRGIKDLYLTNRNVIDKIESEDEKVDKLCELNVIDQVFNVSKTTIVQNAWRRGQPLTVHGWIYDIKDGLLRDLDICISNFDQVDNVYQVVQDTLNEKGHVPVKEPPHTPTIIEQHTKSQPLQQPSTEPCVAHLANPSYTTNPSFAKL